MDAKKAGLILTPIYIVLFACISTVSYRDSLVFSILLVLIFATYFIGLKYKVHYALPLALTLIIGTRLPFFFNLPTLSDDFFRFLWDGMLLNEGINPIGNIPINQVIGNLNDPAFAETLLKNMNSASYLSVYPPFHQAFFAIAYFFAGSNLLVGVNFLRGMILIIELLTFLILFLRRSSKEHNYFFAYLINPLVIIEGVGNVHFEAVLLPFLAIALLDFSKKWPLRSSIPFAASILVKLRSAILTPLFFFRYPPRKRFIFLGVLLVTLFVFFGMFIPATYFKHFENGLGLYFGNFEFNASFYYLFREILTPFVGYNPIAVLAPTLAIVTGISIFSVSYRFRNTNIFELALVVYLIFLLLATTVHPWYIIPTVYLALRSNRAYILVWSFVAFLSYSHYLGDGEPKWIFIAVEYTVLFAAIWLEGRKRRWLQPALRG